MSIGEEARWAWETLNDLGLKGPEDSSLLVVSWNALAQRLMHIDAAFDHPNAWHSVAVKTQPHHGVLRQMASWGYGLEAASFEEVRLAQQADAPYVVFDSPVKRWSEIEACQELGVDMLLNVNTLEELPRMPASPNFKLGIRVNPQVHSDAPEIYHVSGDESKFGVPMAQRQEILAAIMEYPVAALHVHSGSSMKQMQAAVEAIQSVVALADEANAMLAQAGLDRRIDTIDIGGGMAPESEQLADGASAMWAYAQSLRAVVPQLWTDYHLVTEFGQWTHFHTGYAFTDVEYAVDRGEQRVAFLHLGADFLMRDAYTTPRDLVFELLVDEERATRSHDLAGPLCFAGDYIGRSVELPELAEGDQLLIRNTGANAYALWSRHCSRDIPKVLGVDYEAQSIDILSERVNPFV